MNDPRFRLFLALTILCSCVGCDQATKSIAMNSLRDQPPRSYFADTLQLDYAQNPGGFLSLGANLPNSFRTSLFVGTNCVMMLGLLSFLVLKRNMPLLRFISLVYVLSGGVGNLIDRVSNNGLVTDFINLGIGPIRTGVFNVADIAITFGAIAIFLLAFKRETDELSDAPESPVGREIES
ncbi:MAG: signal peptidase II [Pirellulaceae bacterium]|nr:signal peptidase II [Pirellulaceae bacterium]